MENWERPEFKKTGTTTLGMVCTDGVVMGTEHRATMGHLIAHKQTQKLFVFDDYLALTTAGLVGDAQILARYMQAETTLYRLKWGKPMTVRGASTLLANILAGRRYMPYWVQLLLGGVDKSGGYIYSLDAAGGSIPDKMTATGSGSPYVYGVLEDHYRENITVEEGIDIAVRGLTASMKRDAASGDGYDIVAIKADGVTRIGKEEAGKRREAMKLGPINL